MPVWQDRVVQFPMLSLWREASTFPVRSGIIALLAGNAPQVLVAQHCPTTRTYSGVKHTVLHDQYPVFQGVFPIATGIKLLENECSPPPP